MICLRALLRLFCWFLKSLLIPYWQVYHHNWGFMPVFYRRLCTPYSEPVGHYRSARVDCRDYDCWCLNRTRCRRIRQSRTKYHRVIAGKRHHHLAHRGITHGRPGQFYQSSCIDGLHQRRGVIDYRQQTLGLRIPSCGIDIIFYIAYLKGLNSTTLLLSTGVFALLLLFNQLLPILLKKCA